MEHDFAKHISISACSTAHFKKKNHPSPSPPQKPNQKTHPKPPEGVRGERSENFFDSYLYNMW